MRRCGVLLGGLVIGVAMVSLLTSGCRKAAEKAAEKAIEAGMAKDGNKANVDISGGKVSIETKDGKAVYSSGRDAKVPDNFPKDVYAYDGGKVIASVSVPDGFSLTIETADSADKVVATVKDKMNGLGWKQEMEMKQDKISMVTYKKGERTVTFNISLQQQATQVSIFASAGKGK